MFPGMFMRKPDKAVALKQLKNHVAMFGAWVVVIRVAPYILHFLSDQKEELILDLRDIRHKHGHIYWNFVHACCLAFNMLLLPSFKFVAISRIFPLVTWVFP
ncbi:hypothetical protein DM860_015224 [Cuscuta australis]|uniref:Mitochondrial import receptor subunit TOM6 homolog n=1 Tax=Cuscuta australis TaxID=267555 RepID=A0A328D4L5_9ASTE|nr:hypothetical protein DM860_015224 [Cuscuta australis]